LGSGLSFYTILCVADSPWERRRYKKPLSDFGLRRSSTPTAPCRSARPGPACLPPPRHGEREPRYPHRPGAARPPGRQHHHDLHPHPQPGTGRGPESRRSDLPVMTDIGIAANAPALSCSASRYITASQPRPVCQPYGKSGPAQPRRTAVVRIYGTTHSYNEVQER
jgi:hypothetical protein